MIIAAVEETKQARFEKREGLLLGVEMKGLLRRTIKNQAIIIGDESPRKGESRGGSFSPFLHQPRGFLGCFGAFLERKDTGRCLLVPPL